MYAGQVTPNASGEFQLSALPPAALVVRLKHPHHLAVAQTVTLPNAAVIDFGLLRAGDANNDADFDFGWEEPLDVRANTSASDFDADLVVEQPTVVVLTCPGRMRAVYASYLGATLRKLMLDLDTIGERNKGPLPVPVGIILDEFPTLGKLDSLVVDVNLVRKRRISIMIGAQTKGQFHMIYGNEGTQALFTGLATQVIYGGCDADTAEFYSKASGTATTDANADDPNSHLRQRPLLTVDEVVTPQLGNCTIFARYVEAGFATQVVLNARLTRFYERDDWKKRLSATKDVQPLLLERGISLNLQPVVTGIPPIPNSNTSASTVNKPSTLEIAALMARVAAETQKQTNGKVQAISTSEMRNRHEKRKRDVKEVTQ